MLRNHPGRKINKITCKRESIRPEFSFQHLLAFSIEPQAGKAQFLAPHCPLALLSNFMCQAVIALATKVLRERTYNHSARAREWVRRGEELQRSAITHENAKQRRVQSER